MAAVTGRRRGETIYTERFAEEQVAVVVEDAGDTAPCEYIIEIRRGPDTEPEPVCGIKFQLGPVHEAGLNGGTNEALLAIVADRLRSFQASPYSCRENALALTKVEEALMWLDNRTRERRARGVEGTSRR